MKEESIRQKLDRIAREGAWHAEDLMFFGSEFARGRSSLQIELCDLLGIENE